MLNKQAPEAAAKGNGSTLDLHSMFYTLQGEGPHTGVPSVFIRLAGCNLQCPHCDTEYTQGRTMVALDDLVGKVAAYQWEHNVNLVVLTGGEPTRQPIAPLVRAIAKDLFMRVQIESNGVLPLPHDVLEMVDQDLVDYVVSPKTSRIHETTRQATAFKYVIDHASINQLDGLPLHALGHKAAPHIARPHPEFPTRRIYVNPMDAQDPALNQLNLMACRDSALRHGYTCGVQLHKLLNLE